ncbi:hypothetical protein FGG08_005054 [Glutinoglossum americanum]|uniref:DUF7587 domain-containing protein n=1 Tax=Glutinoglossum americanum TaxID=1670608 RepID=A0A9P8I7Z5_9PEZI|nr:hypothetical protein FGG08_005054 [Glutinoglossum americanum]
MKYDGEGLFAEDTDTEVNFGSRDCRLLDHVERHLDWGNRDPTPFISMYRMYSDEDVAFVEAERRVRRGKKDVRVYKIDMRESGERTEYRNIRLPAEKLDFDIPEMFSNLSLSLKFMDLKEGRFLAHLHRV